MSYASKIVRFFFNNLKIIKKPEAQNFSSTFNKKTSTLFPVLRSDI